MSTKATFKTHPGSMTGRLYIPATMVRDSQFPLKHGKNTIHICNCATPTIVCISPENRCQDCPRHNHNQPLKKPSFTVDGQIVFEAKKKP